MINKKRRKIYLFGGLGNVLFQIAFAKFVSQKKNEQVELVQIGNFNFDNLILDLSQGDWCGAISRSKWSLRQLNFIYKVLAALRPDKFFIDIEPANWRCESFLESNHRAYFGYFQKLEFANYAKADFREAIIRNAKSDWFFENAKKSLNKNVLGIHIRRGDYTRAGSYHGLLSEGYYQSAINHISGIQSISVFSDDILLARGLFESININCEIEFVSPPPDIPALDSLLLLSSATHHVIANSTFSWWAAFMSPNSKKVIYPKQWLLSRPDYQFSFPDNWEGVQSTWSKKF